MGKDFPKLLVSVVACELAGLLGTPFTASAIPTWYAGLVKPPFNPPSWIFAPVWTLLYLLMGLSWYLVWRQGWEKKEVRSAGTYFFIQLALNATWSVVFFGLRSPILGLINIGALLVFILLTMKRFFRISKPAAWLLSPYLLWVSFATILNASIVILN